MLLTLMAVLIQQKTLMNTPWKIPSFTVVS